VFIVDKLGQIVEACQLQSALSNCPGVGFAGSSVNVPLTRTSARHFREHEYDSTFLGSWRGALDPCLTGDTLYGMNEVTIRELRNRGGLVLDRVTRGEAVTVTRDGHPVACGRCGEAEGGRRRCPGRDVVTDSPVRHERGVLDTSTVIMLSRLENADLLPLEPCITAVTLAELTAGPLVASTDEERAARQAHVQQAEADFDPLPFDAQAARAFGRVAASLRRAGRKTAARAYDAMVAATAMAHDLPLYTCNPQDFAGIEGLTVVSLAVPESTGESSTTTSAPS